MVSLRATIGRVLFLTLLLTGCSTKQWWGETPRPSILKESEMSVSGCGKPERILAAPEREAQVTFDCWVDQLDRIWTQVQGKGQNSLTDGEIATLVRSKIIRTSGDPQAAIRRLVAIKSMLGFPGPLHKSKADQWVLWARKNLLLARQLYRKFLLGGEAILERDLYDGINLISEFLDLSGWTMESSEFARNLIAVFDIQDREIRSAMLPGIEIAINLINMTCPVPAIKDFWDGRGISACLGQMITQFKVGGPWFEFLLNSTNELSSRSDLAIRTSLQALDQRLSTWFNNPSLSPLLPARWIEFSRRLGANPPENLLNALRIIRRYNNRSNEEAIYPEAMIKIFHLVRRTQEDLLDGIHHYIQATIDGHCSNSPITYWTDCVLRDYERLAESSPAIKIAWRVKNLNYGQATSPLDGRAFSRITLFHQLASEVIALFHNDCPPDDDTNDKCHPDFITTDPGDPNDKLVELITVGVSTVQIIESFLDNIQSRLHHFPTRQPRNPISAHWEKAGLARLVAATNDILVKRTQEERNLLTHVISLIKPPTPSSLSIDRLAVTAIMTAIDSLASYREKFISLIPPTNLTRAPDTTEILVQRTAALHVLPEYLEGVFPRTSRSCTQFGFKKSCGIALDEILPRSSEAGTDRLFAGDLDVITLVGMMIEGLVDSCDRDGDALLSWNILNGDSELDCAYERAQGILKNLVAAGIIPMSRRDHFQTDAILFLLNTNPITRLAGKVAIARGTTDSLIANPFIAPFYQNASIGSLYGLISDITNQHRARAKPREGGTQN